MPTLRAVMRMVVPMPVKNLIWSLIGGREANAPTRFRQRLRRLRTSGRYPIKGRRWKSDLSFRQQWSMIIGIYDYEWRGVPMLKHPMEQALYPLLFWQAKPKTIIEIGSFGGGSAIWFSDTMAAMGLPCQIISIDINAPAPPSIPANVTFIEGDVGCLGDVLGPEFLASLERPLLVIEDASHQYKHTLAALNFFDPVMQLGEYLIVEDATTLLMGNDAYFDGGPARALSEFLASSSDRYEVDAEFCDRFGYNATGNPNGYLRRK